MNARVRVVVLALAVACSSAMAAEQSTKHDDLDVTMQIIVDPNAKVPDEVVRRIPLPTARSAAPNRTPASKADEAKRPEGPANRNERAQESTELGREAADNARERAREAQQQREEARNANDKDRDKDKDRGPPDRPQPDRPPRP